MATSEPQSYKASPVDNGIKTIELSTWKQFNNIIVDELLDHPDYIFRGHRRNDWKLEPTLARILKRTDPSNLLGQDHLDNFRYAIRGRRGTNPSKLEDTDLWALGQHHGLATPLLDWTSSPYVALFFAFAESIPRDATDTRVVCALNEAKVKEKSNEIIKESPCGEAL